MSQYVNIFLVTDGDEFIRIGNFSRNTKLGNYFFNIAPYGKVRKITESVIQSIIEDINYDLGCCKESIQKYRDAIASIERYNNSLQEKFEKIDVINSHIEELQIDQDDIRYAFNYMNILNSIAYCSGCSLYFGVEISKVNPDTDIEKIEKIEEVEKVEVI